MKKLFIGLTSVLVSSVLNAQNPSWILAPNYKPNMELLTAPIPLPTYGTLNNNPEDGYDGEPALRCQNIQVDKDGLILFFIIDQYVYDREGRLIEKMFGQTYFFPSTHDIAGLTEVSIIPVPGDCNSYYIVSGTDPAYDFGLSQAIVEPFYGKLEIKYDDNGNIIESCSGLEVSNDGYPMISLYTSNLFLTTSVVPNHYGVVRLATSTLRNDNTRLLFINNDREIYTYLVDANGITFQNQVINIPNATPLDMRSELEVINYGAGYRIAAPYYWASAFTNEVKISVFIADLDVNGLVIGSSEKNIHFPYLSTEPLENVPYIYGLEFAPLGEKLYISKQIVSPSFPHCLYSADLISSTPVAIEMLVPGTNSFEYSEIEMAANNEMMFVRTGNLGSLENPDAPNFATDWTFNAVPLSNYFLSTQYSGGDAPYRYSYLLQDQIDGENYTDNFEQSVQCCLDNKPYDVFNYATVSSGTWNSGGNPLNLGTGNTVTIREELRIEAGTTITIQNMILKFAPGARLVIENGNGLTQGGKLILDGTTLTVDDRCDLSAMWLGVEVWGNQSLTQGSWTSTTQGRLELKANSKIEHAFIGALASQRQSSMVEICPGVFEEVVSPSTFNNARNGGIIRSKDATFFGNQRGVQFNTYASPTTNNLSKFTNTVFEWDGLLKDPTNEPIVHARLIETRGIRFEGCDFTNLAPNLFSVGSQGRGIHASNSTFFAGSTCPIPPAAGTPCPNPDNGKFIDLYQGILANNGNYSSFTADLNIFKNCTYGIVVFSARNEVVTNNLFEIREAVYETAGLVMHNSTFYTVEANKFYELNDLAITDGTADSYGIQVDNSGEYDNEIYRNEFHNLKIGGQTERINGIAKTATNYPGAANYQMKGLKWACNDFIQDIVVADLTVVNGRMNYHQGYATGGLNQADQARRAARNRFSLNGEDPYLEHDLLVNNSGEVEYSHINAPRHALDSYTPNFVTPLQVLWNFVPITQEFNSTCPVKYKTKTKIEIKTDKAIVKVNIDELKALIDKGNTALLVQYITTWNDRNAIKNKLIEASPYLSDVVLISYINSNLPAAMLKQVLLANSQLSNEVKALLAAITLPIGTRNQINAAQTGTSERTKLINDIHYHESIYSELLRDLLSDALLDTAQTAHIDSVIIILENENSQLTKELLLEAYILKGDNSNADQVRAELVILNTDPEIIELADIQKAIRPMLSTSWALENNSNYRPQLENLRDNGLNYHVAARAKSILEMVDSLDLVPEILDLTSNHSMQIQSEEPIDYTIQQSLMISMYPNPSTGIVNFDYPNKQDGTMNIQVVDLTGKEVFQFTSNDTNGESIDLSHLKKGLYLVKIVIDNQFIETQKIDLR